MLVTRAVLSTLFGIGAAVLIAVIGPLYGGLLVILSFALVFRSAERVSLRWLLLAFTVAWCIVLVAGIGAIRNLPSDSTLPWAIGGFVPLALSAAIVLVARARTTTTPLRYPE